MALKKARTCSGCRARERRYVSGFAICYLDFPIRQEFDTRFGVYKMASPERKCPKPMTNKLFVKLMLEKRK